MSNLAGRIAVPVEMPFDYQLREAQGEPEELVLLLHGYGESGARIVSKLGSVIPQNWAVLAPNAPFAFAERSEERYRMAYSWYYYNFHTDEYAIDMKPALEFLHQGIDRLGMKALPLRVIGFSQGGYLAPFLGERLEQTKQVIGICSTYLSEELGQKLRFRADNIVGTEDTVVDPENSWREHQLILKRTTSGGFYRLPVAHRIDEQVIQKVGELLKTCS